MATRQRLRELAQADTERECRLYDLLCGEVRSRIAAPAELEHYRAITKQKKEKYNSEKFILHHR